jgi:hypothetical protein
MPESLRNAVLAAVFAALVLPTLGGAGWIVMQCLKVGWQGHEIAKLRADVAELEKRVSAHDAGLRQGR